MNSSTLEGKQVLLDVSEKVSNALAVSAEVATLKLRYKTVNLEAKKTARPLPIGDQHVFIN